MPKTINNLFLCTLGFSLFLFAACSLAEQQPQPNVYEKCDKFSNPIDQKICRSNVDELMAPTKADALARAEEQKAAQDEQDAERNSPKQTQQGFTKLDTPRFLQFPIQTSPNPNIKRPNPLISPPLMDNIQQTTPNQINQNQNSPNPMIWNKPPALPTNKPYPIPMPNQPKQNVQNQPQSPVQQQITPSNVDTNASDSRTQQPSNNPPPSTSIYH